MKATETQGIKEFQAATTDELFGTSAESKEEISSPEKSEVPKEAKEDVNPEKAEKKPEEKHESKKEPSPEKEGESASFNWDIDDNPYKKRYFDTQKWANTIHQQNLELKKSVETINQKLDGTYEEGVTDEPSPEQIKAQSEYQGRLIASDKAAKEQYGEDYVYKMLYAPDAPFQQINKDPMVHYRVANSETPALEALKIVKEYEFFSKFGRDIDKIEANIRTKLESELREKITKEFKEKLKLKEELPKGLGGIGSEPPSRDKGAFRPASIKELFG